MTNPLKQLACANRGHVFPNHRDGTCTRCGLTIHPPRDEQRAAA